MPEIHDLDATAQAELVGRGEIKPLELVELAIDAIERLNPKLNAVITPRYDQGRAAADGPLPDGPFRGVPMLLKDLGSHSAGDPMYEGMRFLRDAGWVEQQDSYLAAGFRAAGFVFLGKTNTPELGILPTTEPLAFGPTRNPWDTGHSTGGSSGGSAAAVAARLVPIAHANDGGGSIRIPASECGLVGLKPSRARTSLGPDYGDLLGGLVCEHVVTRSVRDTAAILDAVAGPRPGDPYGAPPPARPYRDEVGRPPGRLRIGMMTSAPGGLTAVHQDCVSGVEAAAALLESLGHVVEESHPPALDDPEFTNHFVTLWAAGNAWAVDYWTRKVGRAPADGDLEALSEALVGMGRSFSAPQFLSAVEWLQAYSRRVASWWAADGFDLLMTPTIAEPPPRLGEFDSPADNPLAGLFRAAQVAAFTPMFNVTGQPAISLPLHWNAEGLPVGVQLVAEYGREDTLIGVSAQIESAQPWAARRPPICA